MHGEASSVQEWNRFWTMADDVVQSHHIVIDRPAGSSHPRYPAVIYPLDYGYLDGTAALDGDGVDCWIGSVTERKLTGVIVTVDTYKSDTELKWLIGCTPAEMSAALSTHRTAHQAAVLILRDGLMAGSG